MNIDWVGTGVKGQESNASKYITDLLSVYPGHDERHYGERLRVVL